MLSVCLDSRATIVTIAGATSSFQALAAELARSRRNKAAGRPMESWQIRSPLRVLNRELHCESRTSEKGKAKLCQDFGIVFHFSPPDTALAARRRGESPLELPTSRVCAKCCPVHSPDLSKSAERHQVKTLYVSLQIPPPLPYYTATAEEATRASGAWTSSGDLDSAPNFAMTTYIAQAMEGERVAKVVRQGPHNDLMWRI